LFFDQGFLGPFGGEGVNVTGEFLEIPPGGLFDAVTGTFIGGSRPPQPQEVRTEQPVFVPPVIERTGGEARGKLLQSDAIRSIEPQPPTVSIFSDIVGSVTGGSGGGGLIDVIGGVFSDAILRQTTSEEERFITGRGLLGDTPFGGVSLGNVLGGLPTFSNFQQSGGLPVAGILDSLTGGNVGVAPCPTTGSSQGFPAGACITINDWQQLGGPRGFEVAGVSAGGTLILKKKRRRRRRSGLTKGMMTDVDYLARKLGKPAAETYLNRVL